MKKIVIALVIIVVAVWGGSQLLKRHDAKAPTGLPKVEQPSTGSAADDHDSAPPAAVQRLRQRVTLEESAPESTTNQRNLNPEQSSTDRGAPESNEEAPTN